MNPSNSKRRVLSVFSLVMITVGSVDSIRNLPATALFGHHILTFFALATLFFLLPSALVSAELASRFPNESGVYGWVKQAFGPQWGFVAVWLQWISNAVFYPAILSYIAGTVAYLISPTLEHNTFFLITFVITVFWLITFNNFLGMRSSAWFATFCALTGLLLPMLLIIFSGAVWFLSGRVSQIQFQLHDLWPDFRDWQLWVSITGVMLSLCGVEIATVHAKETKNPRRAFPKALAISTVVILVTLICGALSIAEVIPGQELSLVSGIMQTFDVFLQAYHVSWMLPVVAVFLVIGGLGGVNNWTIGPTKGLLAAGQEGGFPSWMLKVNRHGAPVRLLTLQALVVSLLMVIFLLIPSVNGSYWLVNVLATQLYMLMYIVMFIAAIVLQKRGLFTSSKMTKAPLTPAYHIPGGAIALYTVAGAGILGSGITLLVGFFPPENIHVGSPLQYSLTVTVGLILMAVPAFWLFFTRGGKR